MVYEKEADKQMEPASTTKLMTALIAVEHITNLDLPVTAYSTVESDFAGLGASVINIKPGEQISSRELLYALLIPSWPATLQMFLPFTYREAPKNSSSL